ncbi:hypothetical protein [Roseovarius sp. ZX-A-9]|uniref:hypothetical protein n=1 Tax=Roseovarius sp. ZX-A-9 TaxID=3014783 RepID=UPI00232D952A|nr:hypothetical protein [Roseovarius sp. ZX-A-9]
MLGFGEGDKHVQFVEHPNKLSNYLDFTIGKCALDSDHQSAGPGGRPHTLCGGWLAQQDNAQDSQQNRPEIVSSVLLKGPLPPIAAPSHKIFFTSLDSILAHSQMIGCGMPIEGPGDDGKSEMRVQMCST